MVAEAIERHPAPAVLAISALFWLAAIPCLILKPFWYDEMFTYHVSRLPDMQTVWTALRHGADLNPPLFYAIVRASQAIFGPAELGTRFPMAVGIWVMGLAVFAYLRRRAGTSFGLAAMALLMVLPVFKYAHEGRPYGLVLGATALMFLLWSRATEPDCPRRVLYLAGIAACEALALGVHCYAILLFVPFGLGELVRLVHRRRIDWPMMAAYAIGAWPIAFYIPLRNATLTVVNNNPLFHPRLVGSTLAFYEEYIGNSLGSLCLALLATLFVLSLRQQQERPAWRAPLHELAAMVGFCAAPFAATLLAFGYTHLYLERYGLIANIGFACGVGLLLYYVCHGDPVPARYACLAFVLAFVAVEARDLRDILRRWTALTPLPAPASFLPDQPEVTAANGLPIVVSGPHDYLVADHYATPPVAARIRYLDDPASEMKYTNTNHIDASLPRDVPWFKPRSRIVPYDTFVKQNPHFLLAMSQHELEWVPKRLHDEGATMNVRWIAADHLHMLVDVTMPRHSQ